MGRLPVYTNNANIRVAETNKISPLYDGRAIDSLAGKIKDLSVQWQETQNAAETLDGKNKLVSQITDILNKAESYNDYKNPAELQAKEKEMLGELEGVLANVSSGFTNERNAAEFKGQYQLTVAENTQKLKSIFRGKYIDNAKANLAMSYDNNFNSFISSGNSAYKNSYVSDVDNMFKAGYIDEEEKVGRLLKVDDWEKYMVLRQAETDPESVISNLENGNYKIKPEDKNDLLKELNAVKTNKKLLETYQETVKQDSGESDATGFIYGDSSYDQKLQYINDKELSQDISSTFAVKARRAIRQFKPEAEKRISNAQSMADIMQRVYDLNESSTNSTEYLNGIRNIREAIVEMHSVGDITTKDAVSLNNQMNNATRARVSEETSTISYKYKEAKDYFKTTLPPEYQSEAIRDLFYATQDIKEDLGKDEKEKIYRQKAIEVSENIKNKNRIGAEKAYQDIVSKTNEQFISGLAEQKGLSVDAFNKKIDITAKKYGLTREQVINKIKGSM